MTSAASYKKMNDIILTKSATSYIAGNTQLAMTFNSKTQYQVAMNELKRAKQKFKSRP